MSDNSLPQEIEIETLVFPENVRKRLNMYLGDPAQPGKAVSEVADNCIDEILGGHAKSVFITVPEAFVHLSGEFASRGQDQHAGLAWAVTLGFVRVAVGKQLFQIVFLRVRSICLKAFAYFSRDSGVTFLRRDTDRSRPQRDFSQLQLYRLVV